MYLKVKHIPMQITAELSLYPLADNYEGPIIKFIKVLKSNLSVTVHTHSMSTFVKGESSQVFASIESAMKTVDEEGRAFSIVIKAINRDLPVEKGFLEFG